MQLIYLFCWCIENLNHHCWPIRYIDNSYLSQLNPKIQQAADTHQNKYKFVEAI